MAGGYAVESRQLCAMPCSRHCIIRALNFDAYLPCRKERGIVCPLIRQPVPDSGLDTGGAEARWEAAWWMKPTC